MKRLWLICLGFKKLAGLHRARDVRTHEDQDEIEKLGYSSYKEISSDPVACPTLAPGCGA